MKSMEKFEFIPRIMFLITEVMAIGVKSNTIENNTIEGDRWGFCAVEVPKFIEDQLFTGHNY